MPSYDALFNALVTMLVTIDPPGLAPCSWPSRQA